MIFLITIILAIMFVMSSIDSITPTLCRLLNVPFPQGAKAKPISQVLKEAEKILNGGKVEKALIYAPDAIGEVLYEPYLFEFSPVIVNAPIEIKLQSVYPSKTPICFRSMFTGSKPDEGEIPSLMEREVVTCETLFDVLADNGIKVAIVAVEGSSIDKIFRNRNIDYYNEKYDPHVTFRVLDIIKEHKYDFILAYHQEYDDVSHMSHPEGDMALRAFRNNIHSFHKMSTLFYRENQEYNRLTGFFPDHGNHFDSELGVGTHGSNSSEDMNLRHFWGIKKGK